MASMATHRRLAPRWTAWAAIAFIVLALGGCADFGAGRTTQTLAPVSGTARSLPAEHGAWPDASWVDRFGDPQLRTLVDEAVADSPTLQAAMARVEAARALAQGARSGLYPHVDVQGGIARERISETDVLRGTSLAGKWFDQVHLSAGLTYDLDFWGKHRSALQSALSTVREADAEQQSARLLLSTSVARVYARLATLYAVRDVTATTIAQRRDLAGLERARHVAGLDTQVGITLQSASVASIEAELTQLDDAIDVTRHQIAALMGKGPDRGLAIARPTLLVAPQGAPHDGPQAGPFDRLPDDARIGLLSRRPDLVAARWRVEAASKDIETAKAEFLPDISVSAMGGLTTITPSDFLLGASRAFSFGPSVTLPVFEGGKLRADLHGRYAQYDAAVADYNQTLVDALRETADTVGSLHAVATARTQQAQALELSRQAWALATDRWHVGLADQLTVLDAQTAVLAAQRQAAQLRGQQVDLMMALVWNLGGGYEDDARPQLAEKP
ncbi:efflux transporter outer membrane subunit [Cupriavidus plantarum]|uniref:NodT family efflux transporter outer membrane factor (OMF) lipoprotein n=1 Tax=Cupriavidus plantarum TaxID=942865 RepID=A0A316EXH5_9BURK|nr:efflux transporter outer membrane subunit [Cupriavidus plantarum]PWK35643.1 NodT family efflux transporter outer membrane factor (OMF) lipoprotein [Cupriavidus plantarum]